MNYLLVVNPHSGKKQSAKILDEIVPRFASSGVELTVIQTEFAGHARELAAQVDFGPFDGLLALGGDGTFHEVINGMCNRRDGKMIPIGMIPGGTGNSFLHDLELVDPIRAVDVILSGRTRFVDIAEIQMNHITLYSLNMIGWGLVTDVGKRSEVLRWLGPQRYTIASIIEIFFKRTRKALLVIDGKEIVREFTFIIACNSLHVGKGMRMAPNAKLDDGLIDLIVVEGDISRRRLLSVLPKLFDGTHIGEPEIKYYQASRFSLIPDDDDSLNIDGEMFGTTPITVNMLHKAIEIFACPEFNLK